MVEKETLEIAKELIADAERISVLTGAGISTDSGIPDFRGPNGIWTTNPEAEKYTNIDNYLKDPELRKKTWKTYTDPKWQEYEPNPGHLAIKKLQDDKKLLHVATQNIDGLHRKSGIEENRLSEIHGSLDRVRCMTCGWVFPTEDYPPHGTCIGGAIDGSGNTTHCDGIVKPDLVFFGEPLDPVLWHRAESAATSCDVYLVVGTSLGVWPTADLPVSALMSGIPVIYVNGDQAPNRYLKLAQDYNCRWYSLEGSISDILPEIV